MAKSNQEGAVEELAPLARPICQEILQLTGEIFVEDFHVPHALQVLQVVYSEKSEKWGMIERKGL